MPPALARALKCSWNHFAMQGIQPLSKFTLENFQHRQILERKMQTNPEQQTSEVI